MWSRDSTQRLTLRLFHQHHHGRTLGSVPESSCHCELSSLHSAGGTCTTASLVWHSQVPVPSAGAHIDTMHSAVSHGCKSVQTLLLPWDKPLYKHHLQTLSEEKRLFSQWRRYNARSSNKKHCWKLQIRFLLFIYMQLIHIYMSLWWLIHYKHSNHQCHFTVTSEKRKLPNTAHAAFIKVYSKACARWSSLFSAWDCASKQCL